MQLELQILALGYSGQTGPPPAPRYKDRASSPQLPTPAPSWATAPAEPQGAVLMSSGEVCFEGGYPHLGSRGLTCSCTEGSSAVTCACPEGSTASASACPKGSSASASTNLEGTTLLCLRRSRRDPGLLPGLHRGDPGRGDPGLLPGLHRGDPGLLPGLH